jgi:UDP-hydrolysing UDP-N-acetyl-D-glucosamine 2-epimerase
MTLKIGAMTFSRSEYSSFRPLLKEIEKTPELKLFLYVGGMHLSPRFGNTITSIEEDGFHISERIPFLLCGDSQQEIAGSIGLASIEIANCFSRFRPDILLLVGDRYELLAASSTALIFNIPIGHLSGGDTTEGAIDNQVRDSVTKMSHLHFVSMKEHADKVIGMGEEPWRVHVTGDPALDEIRINTTLSQHQLEEKFGFKIKHPFIITTYHPATLGSSDSVTEIEAILSALSNFSGTIIFTSPNADVGNQSIIDRILAFSKDRENVKLIENFGKYYYSILKYADSLVGNSSSGIWEAPSFQLPAVNIGFRQQGRIRAKNVIDVSPNNGEIVEAIRKAISKEFRNNLAEISNPYGDGHASEKIVNVLRNINNSSDLLVKKFHA